MEPFKRLEAVAVPIDIANCDTDQIIPARFLRRAVDDPDYPRFFFHDLRFDADGSSKGFIIDQPAYAGAGILVAERNWGCGSSRENAVTALEKNGIRAVIAPSIADIHFNNCTKRGVVPVCLSEDECASLRRHLHLTPGAKVTVDLEAQVVIGPQGARYDFEIAPADKERLLGGLDDIDLTLAYADEIARYEARRGERMDWLSP